MSEEHLTQPQTLESQPTTEPEPEGVKEVQGEKVVPLSALVAERARVRDAEREKLTKEYEPVKQQLTVAEQRAQQLEQQLAALQAQHAPKPPDIPDVADDEAEKFARQYELYTATGLDIGRAKQIIANQRKETERIATEAAQRAVQPYAQMTDQQASKQNFLWAASQRDANGQPLVDPRALAEEWALLPAELTARGEVAQHLLDVVIGKMARSGKRPPSAPLQEPVFTEAPGGARNQPYQMGNIEKRLARVSGMSDKDFADRAKTYQPGAVNFLE